MSGSTGPAKGKKNSSPRPFPVITPQSYLPGSAAAATAGSGGPYPGSVPPVGLNQYPAIPPSATGFNTGYGPPPPPPYNPMGGLPLRSYPRSMIQRQGPYYYPRHHRPMRISRRHRSRPTVRIIRADSCSSISTCSSISSCSPRCHRSCSYSTSHTTFQPQQQPIILLPIQCQPQQPAIAAPIQGQSQPIILPSTQVQHQFRALPPINSTPMIIQPLSSLSQAVSTGKPQLLQAGPIQYVQATPKSSSQLQFTSIKPPSSIPPPRVLVNSTNRNKQLF